MSHQDENIEAYERLTKRGFTVVVPREAKCQLCEAPHLPYHPYCRKCSDALDKALLALDEAWKVSPDPFNKFDEKVCHATVMVLREWRARQQERGVK